MSVLDAVGMERDNDSVFGILRILVFVQMAIAFVSAFEAAIVGFFFGAVGSGVLTLVGAVVTLVVYIGIGRRSDRSRRWLRRLQRGWIALGLLDLGLALFLAQRILEPMALLTRLVLPYVILRLIRRPDVAIEFWPAPTPDALVEPGTREETPAHAMA